MNKKLIGISVATLFAASGALAQTSVTMYGTVDAGIAYNHGAFDEGKIFALESGQQSYSRIGFKGTEDLGNNLKAIFVLEQGVQIDTGSSGYSTIGSGIVTEDPFTETHVNNGIFSSQAYVGLSGNFGTVTLGRQFSPLYESYMAIDPFKNGFAANINSFFGTVAGSSFGSVSLYQRMDNAIIYHTPDNLSGFKGALAYGFGEQAGSFSAQSQVGLSLGYANGPLTVTYAHHHANNDHATVAVIPAIKTHFIGATFDFGAAKLHGAIDQNKAGSGFKTQDYMVGVTVPFGNAHSVFADITFKQDKINSDANAKQFGIGYTYNLSKRTNLYAAYTYVKNDKRSFVSTTVPGNTVNTLQLGVRHMF